MENGTRSIGVTNGRSPSVLGVREVTIADFLKTQGYIIVMIGKWHLGLGLSSRDFDDFKIRNNINPSPVHHGFDRWFGISASLDFPPYTYLNDSIPLQPGNTATKNKWS